MATNSDRVRIEKAITTALGDVMNEMRAWLDSRQIQPIEFKTRREDEGRVILEICFQSEEDARHFQRQFP
jgi:hypothetical protein